MSDLTGPRFEPQTSRSRDERVTARPIGRCFPEFTLARITFYQKLIFQNLNLPGFTFGRNYVSSKTYFPEIMHILAILFRKMKFHVVITLRKIYWLIVYFH